MKIYTKTGDLGQTSLLGGSRVPKHHLRIESYGTLDELNSHIGFLRDFNLGDDITNELLEIQDRLFTLGSLLASEPGKSKVKIPLISDSDVEFLEKAIDAMNEVLPEMRSFVLPGGHPAVSSCHIARCVCRRAERIIVDLSEHSEVPPIVLEYTNRLSDYLFVLSRKITLKFDAIETPWKPRM
ncbi:MAG: cob(I)yrinic acid a,c-diamide adenosyltransferase [Bacteroidia bacterium]